MKKKTGQDVGCVLISDTSKSYFPGMNNDVFPKILFETTHVSNGMNNIKNAFLFKNGVKKHL